MCCARYPTSVESHSVIVTCVRSVLNTSLRHLINRFYDTQYPLSSFSESQTAHGSLDTEHTTLMYLLAWGVSEGER